MTAEVFYPYVEKAPDGNRIFAAFTDLSFADRALVIVEPGNGLWAMHIVRQDNIIRVFDDCHATDYRGYEGLNHSINSIADFYKHPTDIKDANEFLSGGIGVGADHIDILERKNAATPLALLDGLDRAWNFRRSKKSNSFDTAKAKEIIDHIFSDHLGFEFDDLIEAGGPINPENGRIEKARPLSEIPLRPLLRIPDKCLLSRLNKFHIK